MIFRSYLLCLFATTLLSSSAGSQSLKIQDPAPLKLGINRAAVDSFVGEQYWFFYAEPGHFHIAFTYGGKQEGFSVGGHAVAGAAFAPKTPGAILKPQDIASGSVFDGSVTQRTRVMIEVDPAKSPLVRQTSDYTLAATGNVSFGSSSTNARPAPIVGVYAAKLNDYGAVKFRADGSVLASSGATGTWTLFDADTQVYNVILGGQRLTLTLQPGRGLADTRNHNLYFELQR